MVSLEVLGSGLPRGEYINGNADGTNVSENTKKLEIFLGRLAPAGLLPPLIFKSITPAIVGKFIVQV